MFDINELVAQLDMYEQLTKDYAEAEELKEINNIVDNLLATESLIIDMLVSIGVDKERATRLLEENKIKPILQSLVAD